MAYTSRYQTGATMGDEPVSEADQAEMSVIQAIHRCRKESEDSKTDRIAKSRMNRDVYLGRMDWSYKQEGQSTEVIPKVPVTVEQLCAFIKRGLINFGDWFSVDLDRTIADVVDGAQIREVVKCFLNELWDRNNKTQEFPLVVSDAVKSALMESLIILKVHGGLMRSRKPVFLPAARATKSDSELKWEDQEIWRLRIDVIPQEDYYPDPTGNGLYEIHRCERDLHEVVEAAEDGMYDLPTVKKLIDSTMSRPLDEERTDSDRNQPQTTDPSFRKKVLIDEFWGTLLNSDGTVAHRNCVTAVANERFLIRKPEPNPFWHQESPFVAAPLIRVPFSVWHKALYDDASPLAMAINELFSLMIDGAIAAVWGIKQVRIEDLEDPGQVAGGIKQGDTIAVKQTLPHNADAIKVVATGDVPREAMAMYEALNREYHTSVLSSETKVGQLPPKQVLATELVETSQSQAVTLDGVVGDIEIALKSVIRKSWLNILQNADDIPSYAWTSSVSRRVAMLIMRASPEERYSMFAGKSQFRVHGLSATMQRALDFQKMMALMQAAGTNPILLRAFVQKYSGDAVLQSMMRALNLNPDNMQKTEGEAEQAPQEMQEIMGLGQMISGKGQGRGASAPGPSSPDGAPPEGQSTVPAQINQLQSPVTGLTPNA